MLFNFLIFCFFAKIEFFHVILAAFSLVIFSMGFNEVSAHFDTRKNFSL